MKSCNCCTTYSAPDLMDGGVAAALIEKEVAGSYTRTDDDGLTLLMVQQQRDQATARAEKAEQERDEARKFATAEHMRTVKAEQERDEARKKVAEYVSLLAAPLARPLTADDISDEMLHRAEEAFMWNDTLSRRAALSAALAAALTEPPARPEGAEEIEAILAELPDTDLPITDAGRADLLAERGIRVTGAES